jgi:hypothetical protein
MGMLVIVTVPVSKSRGVRVSLSLIVKRNTAPWGKQRTYKVAAPFPQKIILQLQFRPQGT